MLLALFFFLALAAPVFGCTSVPFQGTDLRTNAPVELDPKRAKATVVVFVSSNCPCSRSHEPSLRSLAEDFPEFQFLGVHSNQGEEGAREHFLKAGFPFPLIRDEAFKFANALGALKTPHAFVIGPEGQCWFNGGVDSTRVSSPSAEPYLRKGLSGLAQRGRAYR